MLLQLSTRTCWRQREAPIHLAGGGWGSQLSAPLAILRLNILPPNGSNSMKHCHNLNSYLHFINNDNIYFNTVKSE